MCKQWPYEAAALAFEVIPRTLAQNCGVNVIRTMTALQGKVVILHFHGDVSSRELFDFLLTITLV